MTADVGGELRLRCCRRLEERTDRAPLVERKPPAIRVGSANSSPQRQPREREDDVGRYVALHPEELTHVGRPNLHDKRMRTPSSETGPARVMLCSSWSSR